MQNINVNIVPDNYPQTINFSQGDIGREFKINVTDFNIPAGATVKIQARKPSGFGFSVVGVVDGNSVTFVTTEEMTDEDGRFQAELQITAGDDVIGTANFLMVGERNPHPDWTIDGDMEHPEIKDLNIAIETAVDDWLDEHPEATTTVEDGSLTEAKFTDALKTKTVKEYITPEMFGAKGDGTTDDTTALQNASNYSYANNIPLYCFKKYKTTDTVVFKKDVYVFGEIDYFGTNTAIIVDGRDNTNYWGSKYSFNVSNKGAESTNSVGIKVININNAFLEFNIIADFYNSVMLVGDGGGCCYNKVFIDMLYNYHTGLSLINNNGGWVNENTFYGGRFVRKSAYQSESIGVLMDSLDTAHLNQNNTFITPCIESSNTAFYLKYGRNNNVIKLRSEGTAKVLKADSPSYGNIIDVSYGSYAMDSPNAVNYIIKYRQDRIGEKINKLAFDSGDLANLCASNASGASCPSLYLYKHGVGKLPIMPSVKSNESGLEFTTGSYGFVGVLIDVNDSRTFELFIDSIGTVNFGIIQLDSNSTIIDEIPPQYLSYDLFESSQGATKIGVDHYYQSGAYSDPYVFGVSQNCAKFYIFVKYAGNGHILRRMKIYTDNNATYERLNNDVVLDSIPTSTGYNGQFVKAQTPTSSCIGWVYFNSQWNIVPL